MPAQKQTTKTQVPQKRARFTMVPHTIIRHQNEMSGACLRVALIVADETTGWHRRRARITVRQFAAATGLSQVAVMDGIKEALELKVIARQPVNKRAPKAGFSYRLRYSVKHNQIKKDIGFMAEEKKPAIQWRRGESDYLPSDPEELAIAQRRNARRYRQKV